MKFPWVYMLMTIEIGVYMWLEGWARSWAVVTWYALTSLAWSQASLVVFFSGMIVQWNYESNFWVRSIHGVYAFHALARILGRKWRRRGGERRGDRSEREWEGKIRSKEEGKPTGEFEGNVDEGDHKVGKDDGRHHVGKDASKYKRNVLQGEGYRLHDEDAIKKNVCNREDVIVHTFYYHGGMLFDRSIQMTQSQSNYHMLILMKRCLLWAFGEICALIVWRAMGFKFDPEAFLNTNPNWGMWLARFATSVTLMVCALRFVDEAMRIPLVLSSVDVPSSFGKPFSSQSLTEFWGEHWNKMAQASLINGYYKPLCRFGFPKWFAKAATFFMSGVLHAIPLAENRESKWSIISMISYFMIHALLIQIELYIPWLRGRVWFFASMSVTLPMFFEPYYFEFGKMFDRLLA